MPETQKSCPPIPTCAELAEQHLAPIRAFVHSRHGSLTRLTEEMQKRTSTPVTRQAVSRWLHTDQTKRQEPKLGVFLVMEASVRALQTASHSAEPAET